MIKKIGTVGQLTNCTTDITVLAHYRKQCCVAHRALSNAVERNIYWITEYNFNIHNMPLNDLGLMWFVDQEFTIFLSSNSPQLLRPRPCHCIPLVVTLRALPSHPLLGHYTMKSESEDEQPRIDISLVQPSMPSNVGIAMVGAGTEASPSSPAQDKQLVEITSSPESVRQGGCELSSTYARINCERSCSRGHLRELCRTGLRLGDEHRESDALVPTEELYAHEDGALLSTFDSFASSLRSVTAALEDQRKLTDLRESQLAEARDQATTQSAQLLERQPLLPFGVSPPILCHSPLHATDRFFWQSLLPFGFSLPILCSPLLPDCAADQRISAEDSTETSQLSLHEGCQLNAIWKCLVVLHHSMFKIKGVSLHFREELAPWRRAHNVAESGIKLSVQGSTQTMEKFDKETRHVIANQKHECVYSDSEWQNLLRIYKKLWPFKGPMPEALDWWSLSTQELVQAVPWTNLFFKFNHVVIKMHEKRDGIRSKHCEGARRRS